MTMKLMKACNDEVKPEDVPLPTFASPKIDGFRGMTWGGWLRSNTMKPYSNIFTQTVLSNPILNGFDGEVCVGNPYDRDVFNVTSSAMRTKGGEPDFDFWVFDHRAEIFDKTPAEARLERLYRLAEHDDVKAIGRIHIVEQRLIKTLDELLEFEAENDRLGYEGTMCRRPDSPYKNGRSTLREGWLIKRKPTVIEEAVITGYYEMMHNDNDAYISEDGRQVRSSHQENMTPAGVLGGFIVKECSTGKTFNLGGGYTAKEREEFWRDRDSMIGEFVRFKHFPYGRVDLPRQPVYKGIRPKFDFEGV